MFSRDPGITSEDVRHSFALQAVAFLMWYMARISGFAENRAESEEDFALKFKYVLQVWAGFHGERLVFKSKSEATV